MDETTKKSLITVAIIISAFILYILVFGLIGEIRRTQDDEDAGTNKTPTDSLQGQVFES